MTLALTHASAPGEASNERLEFLGDRVLGLLIAEWLYEDDPGASEGALAPRLNALVRRETCAAIGAAIGLGEAITVASSERGALRNTAVIANACEAVIAALYLDGGLDAARRFVRRHWAEAVGSLEADMRDAKTALQEWAQGAAGGGRGMPQYNVVERTGPDHAPRFVVEVAVTGLSPARGTGGSKRQAEQAAASAMLAQIEGGA